MTKTTIIKFVAQGTLNRKISCLRCSGMGRINETNSLRTNYFLNEMQWSNCQIIILSTAMVP